MNHTAYRFQRSTYWGRGHWVVLHGHRELGRVSRGDAPGTWDAFDNATGAVPPGGHVAIATGLSSRTDAAAVLDAVWTERRKHNVPPLDDLIALIERARYDVVYDKDAHHYEHGHHARAGVDNAFDTLLERIKLGRLGRLGAHIHTDKRT